MNKVNKLKLKLNRIKIDAITRNITQSCWNYNIQYKILLKTSDLLLIKLIGDNKRVLLKYHKKNKVELREYEKFLYDLDQFNVEKGVYITTGIFDCKIDEYDSGIFNRKVQRINNTKFIRRQASLDKLSFLEYLPQ